MIGRDMAEAERNGNCYRDDPVEIEGVLLDGSYIDYALVVDLR